MEPRSATEEGPNLFQSPFWAEQKRRFGWASHSSGPGAPLLLLRRLGPLFSIGYLPYAGARGETHREPPSEFDLHIFTEEVSALASFRGATFLRWDVPFPVEALSLEALEEAGYLKAPTDVQPPTTVVLDLGPEPDALLGAMKGKTRYNVRLAEKRGVTVSRSASAADLEEWYNLYRITAERDRITIHSPQYYRSLFEIAADRTEDSPEISLYLAHHEGDLLAGIIVARYGPAAYYLYGASSNEKRNLMPAYALQWRAIQDARSAGARSYDFFGIPPAEASDHPMHGLYRFKVGFGGQIIKRPGAYDFPLKRKAYGAYRLAEAARNYYYKVIRKRGG